jgi:hypothetical protein
MEVSSDTTPSAVQILREKRKVWWCVRRVLISRALIPPQALKILASY